MKEQTISPILIAAALIGSLFFQGRNLYVFLAVQAALVCALTYRLMRAQAETVLLKIDFMSGAVLLFWVWLAVSAFLSRVPYVSGFIFWWIGVLPMVYLIHVLSPETEDSGSATVMVLLAVGSGLAAWALCQFIVWQDPPRGPFIYRNLLAAFLGMLALIVSARFLMRDENGGTREFWFLAGIFLMVLIVGLIQSRGVLLCFSIGAFALLSFSRPFVKKRKDILTIIAVYAVALALAQVSSSGEMGARMATLQDPYQAGGTRFVIWEGSWELWQQSPWYGNGIGTYWLAYPAYRQADDTNAGFYVHNDYLQILIESGWPALLLLCCILLAILFLFVKTYRSESTGPSAKIEAAGLFAALLSIFLHSLLDFNLYTVPTMILAGLAMGRLRSLCHDPLPSVSMKISLGRWLRPTVFRCCLLFLGLLPGIYFVTVGVSYYYLQRGEALIEKAQLKEALGSLRISEALWSNQDRPKYLQANIYQLTLQENPQMDLAVRRQVYDDAQMKLQQAESLNPWRPEIHAVRGQLYRQNRDLAGPDWYEKAVRSFRHALAIDPRCYDARVFYARMLLETGDAPKAADVLKAGLKYWHTPDARMISYYRLTAFVCRQQGDHASATEAEKKMAAVIAAYQRAAREKWERPF
ncbi:MAG TPA: O-antigen ligase family protein [Syntrophales bacterium]|nr:O-antigen ligase family protein [Syntrophales bacterium]HOI17011.1 O-antigen ligase family protein [Geobacteraceae bacterium]